MPEHLRALVVILGVAVTVFVLARESAAPATMPDEAYVRRRNVWFAVTLIAFLSHNFWIFVLLTWPLLGVQHKKDANPFALYCLLIFAVPAFSLNIPGFGLVNYLFGMSYTRLLALAILLPIAIGLYRDRAERPPALKGVDLAFMALFAWITIRHFQQMPVTVAMRDTVTLFLDMALPYYVASRVIRSPEQFRDVASALVLACMIVAVLAVFETVKHWRVYTALRYALDLPRTPYFDYLERGDTGILRAQASLLHPIAVGYATMIGLGLAAILAPLVRPVWKLRMMMFSLAAGLIAAMSRGPWVGAVAMLMAILVLDPSAGRRFSRLVGSVAIVIVILFVTPLGDTIIDYLPFVGTIESTNVDYRQRLFEVSMEVVKLHPWAGDLLYLENPLMEQMRQGQGIIDIVNTYLIYVLPYGIIGLSLFVLAFLLAMLGVRRVQATAGTTNPDAERIGRCLLAIMIGILLTIATTSSISVIPQLYWIVLGLCVSYVRSGAAVRVTDAATAPVATPGYGRGRRQSLREGY